MKCGNQISWFDNIPVLSFLFLRGKCRKCKTSISWQYLVVELVTGVLFLWTYILFGWSAQFFFYSIMIAFLVVIFTYDLRHYLILDKVSLPAIVVAFLFNIYLGHYWGNLVIASLIGAGFFTAQYFASGFNFRFIQDKKKIFEIKNIGRWIGDGDIRLGALMGAILGMPLVLVALFLSYIIGSVFGVTLMLTRKKELSSEVPFGPFLTAGTLVAMFYGLDILNWYLNILY